MLSKDLVFDLVLNISLLALIASLLSRLQLIQDIILQEHRNWKSQVLLSLVFGGIIILSTYTDINIGSYSLNTRVIGAMAAGLLGGPLVGLYASLIGAVYVYVFSSIPAFAMASAFSTVLFGLLGGGFYPYFQRGKWKYKDLFLLTSFAEICEMIALLRFTVPLEMALDTILKISLPMILLNSAGMLIFISCFNIVFIRQDLESSRQLHLASELARKCLPLLQDGLHKGDSIQTMVSVILDETDWAGVMIADKTTILEWQERGVDYHPESTAPIPDIGKEVLESGEFATTYKVTKDSPFHDAFKEHSLMAAPFVIKEQPVGCLIVWLKKQWVFRESELELLQHLTMLGSFQLTMVELKRQEIMLQKAEFKALQFQVNPHFLFNALNTVSCVCREDSQRARELLVILADYFRYNLSSDAYLVPLAEEVNHVRNYLEIEKARFEDKLNVTYDVAGKMDILIPALILQPIVENAVRHGIDSQGNRTVHIAIQEENNAYIVHVKDNGKGFPPNVLEKLGQGENIGKSIGLSNVHKRLQSIYGSKHGLDIMSTETGSTVILRFSKNTKEDYLYENSSS